MVNRTRAAGFAALMLGTLVAGCGNGDSGAPAAATSTTGDADPNTATTAPTGSGYASLCVALDAANAGDITTARATFDHGPLHELANAAIDVDRAVAAHLLEATEAVESDLGDAATPAGQATENLTTLVEATRAALAATGSTAPELCGQENQ